MARKRKTASRVASSRVADDLKLINGIGPAFEKKLHKAGIRTFAQLAKKSPAEVATHLPNLSASQIRKQGWNLQARKLASRTGNTRSGKNKSAVSTTRQHYENFTVEFLLNDKNKLRRLRIMHVQSGDVETWAKWKVEEVSHFLARHTGAQFPERNMQKLEATSVKTKSSVKGTKLVRSAGPKPGHRSSTMKSVKPENKSRTRKPILKTEAVSVPRIKKDPAKSAQPKAKRSRGREQKSVEPVVRDTTQKPEALTAPEVKIGEAKSVTRKTGQSKIQAPILFRPAAEVIPRRFLQKSKTSLAPEAIKHQDEFPQPGASQSQVMRKAQDQIGAIRLLQWNNFTADSDQPVQSLPHDQLFDVKLLLDIRDVPIVEKSGLDISGTLLAKKLGSHEHMVVSETQVVIPYSPIINLRVRDVSLKEGLYRLEAQIKLNEAEVATPTKSTYASLQGGLFQVY